MRESVSANSCLPKRETAEEVLARVLLRWDFSSGFPMPKWEVKCPCCGAADAQMRHVTYHERPGKTRYRVDVGFKCRECSMVWVHGIVCPEEHFRPQSTEHRSTWDAKEIAAQVWASELQKQAKASA